MVFSSGLFAIVVKDSNGNDILNYILKDHIGSINYILNKTGNTIEEMNFDAWGNRRNPVNWTYTNVPEDCIFDRGYTLHEHLKEFKLINMNGRVYDPVIARFLSPDPVLQMPEYSQNFNRYSYVLNNPLKYTDPSGFVIQGGQDDDEISPLNKYSPIKLREHAFTDEKIEKRNAANEALFGKLQAGFGKDDKVGTESLSEEEKINITVPSFAVTKVLQNIEDKGYWLGKSTVSKKYKVYNSKIFNYSPYVKNTNVFLKANVALVTAGALVDYYNYENGSISKDEFKLNIGLGIGTLFIPEISSAIIVVGGLQLLNEANNAFWESPTGKTINWNTQRGMEEMCNPINYGAFEY